MVPLLGNREIEYYIRTHRLIEGYEDLSLQLQSAGFDMRVMRIYEIAGGVGYLDFSNKRRKLPEYRELHTENNIWTLLPGKYYIGEVAEIVNMPDHLMAMFRPRSSFMRMGGNIVSAWVDPGYSGRLRFGIYVFNPVKIERYARIIQICFVKTETSRRYSGAYLGEGI